MAEPPIIIGHSLGGLIVQLLIQRGMGAVGVAIAPTPPHRRFMLDVPLQLSDDAALERCNLASTLKLISFEAFQYAVANELAYEAQSEAYQEYASPQSMRVVLSAVSETASIDVHLPHTPLLFIAGGSDRTVPADVIRSIFERYKHGSASTVDFELFGNSSHLGLLIGRDWQLVADAAIAWADRRLQEMKLGASARVSNVGNDEGVS